jgi:hypothetical protein
LDLGGEAAAIVRESVNRKQRRFIRERNARLETASHAAAKGVTNLEGDNCE